MHVALAPGESLLPGTREALDELFADARVEAALLPLAPQGEGAMPRTARRYLAAWDGRFLHRQNFFAPATRVASRAPLPGHRNADAAEALERVLAEGGRVEALREGGVATRMADDLSAWTAHFREEGRGWGALAAREPRFAGFLPARSRGGWWRHNVRQLGRRVIEVGEATSSLAPLVVLLHLSREAAFTDGAALSIG